MAKRTSLYHHHVEQNARMVNFGGWDMPLHYGSQLEEHHQVRRAAGMFDVSHMTIVEVAGPQARDYLRQLLANDVDKLDKVGKALYGCMLNDQGGVLDDLIVYRMPTGSYRLVVNAATRDKDLDWMQNQASGYGVTLHERDDLAMVAVQGPKARDLVLQQMNDRDRRATAALPPFTAAVLEDLFISRTGYTGEDGFELMIANDQVAEFWRRLLDSGVKPVGLGARDTLRLEAGMNLYGTDMDETITALECGSGWTVAWLPEDRDFIGRDALEAQRRDGVKRKRVGLVLQGKGVLRSHQRVIVDGVGEGVISSGTYSPTLKLGIALARVPAATADACRVEIRSKYLSARVVRPPFVRRGKSCI
ncbi:MAG: glycine cleavage system aminomethyltransferase GcvT [Pseudomonadota bacterium]